MIHDPDAYWEELRESRMEEKEARGWDGQNQSAFAMFSECLGEHPHGSCPGELLVGGSLGFIVCLCDCHDIPKGAGMP